MKQEKNPMPLRDILAEWRLKGVAQVVYLIHLALNEGMSPRLIDSMLVTYGEQVKEWLAAETPGEPPSGHALLLEYTERQRIEGKVELDFGAGASRVIAMIEMAVERGMSLQTVQAMTKAYTAQLAEWKEAGCPGEPPSGFTLVGEFIYEQEKGK
jgi:hypothetical protein